MVVSTQHAERRGSRQLAQGTIREAVIEEVIKPVLDAHDVEYRGTKFLINHRRFVIGGSHGDAGLTGRKIIVDTVWRDGAPRRRAWCGGPLQGGSPRRTPHGGWLRTWWRQAGAAVRGAGSVRHRVARPSRSWCRPSAPVISTCRSNAVVNEVFDLTPRGIIDALKLRRPIYTRPLPTGTGRRPTAAVYQNGTKDHRIDLFTWERTDRVKDLLSAAR